MLNLYLVALVAVITPNIVAIVAIAALIRFFPLLAASTGTGTADLAVLIRFGTSL